MAASALAPSASKLQLHTTSAVHRGIVLFLFLRFLSKGERRDPKKPDAAGRDCDPGPLLSFVLDAGAAEPRRASKRRVSGEDDRTGALLQAIELRDREGMARVPWRSTLSLSFAGIEALGVDPETLRTFPDAFREGMAARARLLGDVGPSDPENWLSALGDGNVHVLLALSSPQILACNVVERTRLREVVREFNTGFGADGRGSTLRGEINAIAAADAKVEILHVELGEDPFEERHGRVHEFESRLEHFGFRDGISQPFVLTDDEGAKPTPPPPGGGRPAPDGTWAPIAPGELFLGSPDEDGLLAVEPANSRLRNGGTYLVWRKLEQDVAGFHAFLAERRREPAARARLAAQMMGRWPSGAPVVRHPDHDVAAYDANTINDFRFEAEDPHGQKCPIGAHVRRTNPRDYLDGEAARRHRILRRGISYGGSLIPPGSSGDGQPRGLLFVALNARLDLQFEFIQRDWINSGELFGRAGADRCPITSALDGRYTDAFQESGRAAPETHLPRFVTTRGGDYFFLPSIDALRALKDGETFPRDDASSTYRPAEGSVRPGPELLTKELLEDYGAAIIGMPGATASPVKRISLAGQHRDVVFLARHADVAHAQTNSRVFTEQHYLDIGRKLTDDDVIIGLPDGDGDRSARVQMLWDAYSAISPGGIKQLHGEMAQFAAFCARQALMRTGPAGRMDLLQQLGFFVPYLFVQRFFGVTGPNWLTPVAIAAKFGRTHAAETPREWLMRAPEAPPEAMPYLTLQTWTRFAFAEVFTNIVRRGELTAMARQAAGELEQHIDGLIAREQARPSGAGNLLAKLVAQWPNAPGDAKQKLRRTRLILTDLLGALMVNVGSPFCRVMETVLDRGSDLKSMFALHGVDAADDRSIDRFIEEALRLKPAGAVQFRTAKADPDDPNWGKLPSGGELKEGDLVVLMVAAANKDWRVFGPPTGEALPMDFSMKRNASNYLTFGGPLNGNAPHPGGPKDAAADRTALHHCWGERIGLLLVREMVRASAQIPLLRRAAGPKGETELSLGLPYSLHVRFPATRLA